MPPRIHLVIALLLSLLFNPQAAMSVAQPEGAKMPGCGMTACQSGCCVEMPCCARFATNHRQPERAPAQQRVNAGFWTLAFRNPPVLFVRPLVESSLVLREEAREAHTLPRLAATCIRLI
ncbi:MAG TPA: hypothetical protein VGH90_09715 [Chthoniobacteraceae bacterium]|jgi:hypothetical protein